MSENAQNQNLRQNSRKMLGGVPTLVNAFMIRTICEATCANVGLAGAAPTARKWTHASCLPRAQTVRLAISVRYQESRATCASAQQDSLGRIARFSPGNENSTAEFGPDRWQPDRGMLLWHLRAAPAQPQHRNEPNRLRF